MAPTITRAGGGVQGDGSHYEHDNGAVTRQPLAEVIELRESYKTAELIRRAEGLQERIERAGVLRRMKSAAANDRDEVSALQRQIAGIAQHTGEGWGAITRARDHALPRLAE